MKKVSVVIPAYNKSELTVKTVQSILDQTYKNVEVIVVDDGSTDNTKECLIPFDGKIKYVYKENGGACSARNLGIRLAKGDYIGFIDCDDLYLPEKLEKCVELLDKDPECGFVHTAAVFIDDSGNKVGSFCPLRKKKSGWIAKDLLKRNFICNSTIVARKSCFDKAGMFDDSIFMPADWDMWIRLAEKFQAGYLDSPYTAHRSRGSYIKKHIEKSKEEQFYVIEKAFNRNPVISFKKKNSLIANVFYRHGVYYLMVDDFKNAKSEFVSALKVKKTHVKSLIKLFILILSGKCNKPSRSINK